MAILTICVFVSAAFAGHIVVAFCLRLLTAVPSLNIVSELFTSPIMVVVDDLPAIASENSV